MEREKAIEVVKEAMPTLWKETKDAIQTLIPELKENEDERIIKNLRTCLHCGKTHGMVNDDEYLVCKNYLEKQKEFDKMIVVSPEVWDNAISDAFENGKKEGEKQKEQNSDTEEYTDFTIYHPLKNGKGEYECIPYSFYGSLTSFSENKDLIDFLHTCFYTKEECEEWIEKQKEQKPAEWSEDYREEDIQTRFAFYTYKDDPSVLYLSNVFVEETSRNHGFGTRILKAAEKAAEAIGAITICLKVKQDSPANAWYRKHGYGYVAFEDGYDWLEKNLEYLKPVKSAKWSEEDKATIKEICDFLYETSIGVYRSIEKDTFKRWIDCLKSL